MTSETQPQRLKRKRRAAGFEFSSAMVSMRSFVKWLIWDGRLDAADADNKAAITKAHEDFLREHYALVGMATDDPPPQYAAGSFGAEFTTLRDRTQYDFGLMEREGIYWNWRDPPTRYLITKRNAALRQAHTPPEPADPARELATFPPGMRKARAGIPVGDPR